ncbi:MAG: choice-of-anchor D domain-containing protein, partial [Calditrichaeota bacterium]|nr:choice-of-anchor D domain-containing protein [Calditrichota bacterium]
MKIYKYIVLLCLFTLLVAVSTPSLAQEHYRFDITDEDMSLLILDARLDNASLISGDEIAVFTPAGLCAGAAQVDNENGFPLSIAAWGDNPQLDDINGFRDDEEIAFEIWESETRTEYTVEIVEIVDGDVVFARNGFAVLSLQAYRAEDEPIIFLSDNDHDFGQVRVGQTEQWIMTIRNDGRQDLVIDGIEVDGESYSLDFEDEISLELRESVEIPVSFAPNRLQRIDGLVFINSNAQEDIVEVPVTGWGLSPLPPTIELSENGHNYGGVPVQETINWTLRIFNTGDEVLEIEDITSNSQVFSVNFFDPIEIESGEGFAQIIAFSPAAEQDYNAELTIISNDPDRGRVMIQLTGQGRGSRISIRPAETDFGEVVEGSTTQRQFSIHNDGAGILIFEADLIENDVFATNVNSFVREARHFEFSTTNEDHSLLITSARIDRVHLDSGDEVAVFTPDGLCAGGTIVRNPGEPIGLAAWQDNAQIEGIDGFREDQGFTFWFWDASTRSEIVAVPDYQDGPEIFQPNALTVLSLNAGEEIQHIDGGILTIRSGHSITVTASFAPIEAGEENGVLALHTNDPTNPEVNIPFTGTGLPRMEIDRRRINFGDVFIDDVGLETVVFSYHGDDVPLTISVEFEGDVFWGGYQTEEVIEHFKYTQTQSDHSLMLTEAILHNQPLAVGNEIAVFTPDGLCAGSATIAEAGVPIGLAVWADNPHTEIVDGFRQEEAFDFWYWDRDVHLETAAVPNYIEGPAQFVSDGMTMLSLSQGEATRIGELGELTLDPTSSVEIAVHFAPLETIEYAGQMTIITDDPDRGDFVVPLEGEGDTAPQIVLSTHDHDYGAVPEPRIRTMWELTVSNEGGNDLRIDSIRVEGEAFRVFIGSFVVRPGQSREIDVRFRPLDFGEHVGRISMWSNDPINPVVFVDLSGFCGERGRDLSVTLIEDWSMISVNVVPPQEFWDREDGPDIVLMTEQLRIDEENHNLIIMKDGLGRFYATAFGFNNIPYWELTQGYLVKMQQDVETTWSGEPIPADADISLNFGWNMIAYFPTYVLDASAPDFYVLSPIIDNVLIAKDALGRFLAPAFNFSNIPPWHESQGYLVKVDAADLVLNYPQEADEFASITYPEPVARSETTPTKSCENMSVLINDISGINPVTGDLIIAYNSNDQVVGTSIVEDERQCGLAIRGDDISTPILEGLKNGEAFEIKYFSTESGREFGFSSFEYLEGSELIYSANGLLVVNGIIETQIPDNYYLSTPYPNPFNSSVTLDYGLPEASQVTIQVFTIEGRVIANLTGGNKSAGHHTIVWDGGETASGVYLVRLETGGVN